MVYYFNILNALDTSPPSITWKLTNLSKLNEKETNKFKFCSFSWKLIAKRLIQAIDNEDYLNIYIRFDNDKNLKVSNNQIALGNNDNESINPIKTQLDLLDTNGILTLYYNLKANGKLVYNNTQIKSFNPQKSNDMLLAQFRFTELDVTSNHNEFIVFLNLDFVYSTILTHVGKNIELYFQSQHLTSITAFDIYAMLNTISDHPLAQECAIQLVMKWSKDNIKNIVLILF